MKKLILNLTLLVTLMSFNCKAQKKDDFVALTILKTANVDEKNEIVQNFYKSSNIKTTYKDLIFDEQSIQLLDLKNGLQALRFSTSNKSINNLYALFNSRSSEFIAFFINITPKTIELYSFERELISSYSNVNGNVNINNIVLEKRSEFGSCMDKIEEDFTNDFIGWAAWNTNPLYSATAAVTCQGCIKRWWKCPN